MNSKSKCSKCMSLCKNAYKKTQKKAEYVLESLPFHILVLLLALFSLFSDDIKVLTLSKSVDHIFEDINAFVFFFFLTELLLFSLFRNKFLGSFYFYLDLISLISLIPEVHFIWIAVAHAIAGDDESGGQSTLDEILANSHLAKASRASQAGSK